MMLKPILNGLFYFIIAKMYSMVFYIFNIFNNSIIMIVITY